MNLRRKLTIATWAAPREGNIYGKLTLDVTEAQRYIAEVREKTGQKVTITHLVGRAAAEGLAQVPSLNGRVVLNRFVPFETVDMAFLVAVDGGKNLGKVKVERVNEKSVAEVAAELTEDASRLRAGGDKEFEKSKGLVRLLPVFLLRWVLFVVGFLTGGLGWRVAGMERFPFGSCIVTSVGMLGLDEGFAPPTPFARVPVYLLVGAIRPQPAVVDGEVVVRDQITVTATVDHRFVDGYQLGTLAKTFREVIENPWLLDGESGPEEPAGLPAPRGEIEEREEIEETEELLA